MTLVINKKDFISNLYLFTLVFLVPLFDSATGFLVRGETLSTGGLGTPSQLIRFFIVFLSILIIKSKRVYLSIALITIYLCVIEFTAFIFHQSFQGLLIGLVFSYKFVFPVFVFFALRKVFQNFDYLEQDIINIVFKSSLFLAICFVVGDLIAIRVGISSSFFRSSGLFSSGNGLGVLLGVYSLIILYGFEKKYLKESIHKYSYFLVLICLVLISTKASAIFLVINLLFLLIRLSLVYKTIIYSLITFVLITFYQPLVNLLNVSFELVIWRYDQKTSWMNFILSAREYFITDAMASFNTTKFIYPRIIFGAGSFLSYESPSHFTMQYKMMEMDSFDTFFMYGVIGLLVYIIIMYYCIKRALFKSSILAFGTIAVFVHSIFAGHTMYDGLAVMAVVFLFLLVQENKQGTKLFENCLHESI